MCIYIVHHPHVVRDVIYTPALKHVQMVWTHLKKGGQWLAEKNVWIMKWRVSDLEEDQCKPGERLWKMTVGPDS